MLGIFLVLTGIMYGGQVFQADDLARHETGRVVIAERWAGVRWVRDVEVVSDGDDNAQVCRAGVFSQRHIEPYVFKVVCR